MEAITSVADIAPTMTEADVLTLHCYLDRVIEADPGFAEAYALKALEYAFSASRTFPLQEVDVRFEREALAREHIDRALSLDPDSGTAYAALGVLNSQSQRRAEAQEAYERALQLRPNDLNALTDYAVFNAAWGRHDEADRLMRRALELGPDSLTVLAPSKLVYLLAKDYDMAAELNRASIRIAPSNSNSYPFQGIVEVVRGNEAQALEALQFSEQLNRERSSPDQLAQIAYGYSLLGRDGEARRVFADIENMAATHYVGPRSWTALSALEDAAKIQTPDQGFTILAIIAANALGDPVLDRPEFAEVRARLFTGL